MTRQRPLVIFLDANILFSAAYGSPALERLWDEAAQGRYLMIASHYVVEEARRNLDKASHRIALEKCLSQVKLVPEADPGMSCPIPLPEKDRPVLMAAVIARPACLATGGLLHFVPFFCHTIQGALLSPR